MRIFTSSILKTVGLFAFVGPPFGALLWLLASTRASPYPQGFLESMWSYALAMGIAIPFSWIFGLIPAVLAGLFSATSWSLLRSSLTARKFIRLAIGTFWGYVATFGFKWLAFGLEDLPGPPALEALGAISGFACAALVPAAWVGSNNSPKPLRDAA